MVGFMSDDKQPGFTPASVHEDMKTAVREFMDWGWRNHLTPHIYAAPYRTKLTFRGSHGNSDACHPTCTDRDHRLCPRDPLTFWDDPRKLGANPFVRLDRSGLVAIDIDHGLGHLNNTEIAEVFKTYDLPPTTAIKTGRKEGGLTLLYRGTRDIPDLTGHRGKDGKSIPGFQVGPLSGDVKHHGHVAIPGALHLSKDYENLPESEKQKLTRVYVKVNDLPPAPLPKFWKNLGREKKPTQVEADAREKKALPPEVLAAREAFRKRLDEDIAAGRKKVFTAEQKVPKGARYKTLFQHAGKLRKLVSFGPEAMRNALEELVILNFEDGRRYAEEKSLVIDFIAGLSRDWNRGDFVVTEKAARGKKREEVMSNVISRFPDRVECKEAIALIREEFDRFNRMYGTNWVLADGGKSAESYFKAVKAAGFAKIDRTGGGCWRVRG
jgi:hypothetical protein